MSSIEISRHVAELRQLRRMAAELQEQITAEENAIKAEMTRRGVDVLSGVDYRVSWKSVVSSRFDAKAFQSAHSGLYAAFQRPSTVRRFCVS